MSVSPGEIRRYASQVHGLGQEVARVSIQLNAEYNQSSQYWTGTAAKSFQSAYPPLNNDIRTLQNKIAQLQTGIERVATDVQRAEQERAEKKRLAEEKARREREQEQREREREREQQRQNSRR